MSLYGEAIAAIKSVILIDERVQSVAQKLDRLADEVRDMKDRLIRLETVIEITRTNGSVLRIAQNPAQASDDQNRKP
jgi:phage shock protein A